MIVDADIDDDVVDVDVVVVAPRSLERVWSRHVVVVVVVPAPFPNKGIAKGVHHHDARRKERRFGRCCCRRKQ